MFIEFETFYSNRPLLISKEHIIAVEPDSHHEGASRLFVVDDRTFTVIYDYEKLKTLLTQ
ncbi:hypothetical protein V7079_26780 [Priestia megaterium]|uniref:hypothetical protein n=1 Tax=Priestia megaterium TaxID=1404 RepID=UPI000BF709A8|nr:hypothetical protein [Priestia megaterium]PFK01961.1 hypothetical protein COI96_06090 [Priestia megaterium]PMD08172.1 hypothetical protein CJ194_19440 [Priestia megaterium]